MSKFEIPPHDAIGERIGGTLIEEFPAVRCTSWEGLVSSLKGLMDGSCPIQFHPARPWSRHCTAVVAWILQISGAYVFRAVYCLANRRFDNE